MVSLTIHDGEDDLNQMILYPELTNERFIGLHVYFEDEDNPGFNKENEFSFTYEDSILLRNYLSGMIDIYEKRGNKEE